MSNNTKETTLLKLTRKHVDGYCIHTCRQTQWVHRYTSTEVIVLGTTSLVEGKKSVKISEKSEVFASESTITNIC